MPSVFQTILDESRRIAAEAAFEDGSASVASRAGAVTSLANGIKVASVDSKRPSTLIDGGRPGLVIMASAPRSEMTVRHGIGILYNYSVNDAIRPAVAAHEFVGGRLRAVFRPTIRPVDINLTDDSDAAQRVVTNAARRVINQHRDEIEALAYK